MPTNINLAATLKFLAGVFLILNAFGVELFHLTSTMPGVAGFSFAWGIWMSADGWAALAHGGGNILARIGTPPPAPKP